MVRLDFWFGLSSVGRRKRIVSGVCFGLMLFLAGPVSAINGSFFENVRDKIVKEYGNIFTTNFAKVFLSSKGFAIPLLDGNGQTITPRNTFYLGFFGEAKSYKVTLTECRLTTTSKKGSNSEHFVEFKGCQLNSGDTYAIQVKVGDSTIYTGKFKVANTDCFANVKTVKDYWKILDYDGAKCMLEAYQTARMFDEKELAEILSTGEVPTISEQPSQ